MHFTVTLSFLSVLCPNLLMCRHSTAPTHGCKAKWVIISVVEVSFVSFPLPWWDLEHAGYEDKVWSAGFKTHTHKKGRRCRKGDPNGDSEGIKEDWDFMVVQWRRVHTPSAGGLGLIPGQGTGSNKSQRRVHKPPTVDPMCCSGDQGSHATQLSPSPAK